MLQWSTWTYKQSIWVDGVLTTTIRISLTDFLLRSVWHWIYIEITSAQSSAWSAHLLLQVRDCFFILLGPLVVDRLVAWMLFSLHSSSSSPAPSSAALSHLSGIAASHCASSQTDLSSLHPGTSTSYFDRHLSLGMVSLRTVCHSNLLFSQKSSPVP